MRNINATELTDLLNGNFSGQLFSGEAEFCGLAFVSSENGEVDYFGKGKFRLVKELPTYYVLYGESCQVRVVRDETKKAWANLSESLPGNTDEVVMPLKRESHFRLVIEKGSIRY